MRGLVMRREDDPLIEARDVGGGIAIARAKPLGALVNDVQVRGMEQKRARSQPAETIKFDFTLLTYADSLPPRTKEG